MPIEIDGNIIATKIADNLKSEIAKLMAHGYRAPHIYILVVGGGVPISEQLDAKQQACLSVDIGCTVSHFRSEIKTGVLLAKIAQLNTDPEVDGILVQMPLPAHIDPNVLLAIAPEKDIAGAREPRRHNTDDLCIIHLVENAAVGLNLNRIVVIDGSPLQTKIVETFMTKWPNINVAQVGVFNANLDDMLSVSDLVLVSSENKRFINSSVMQPNALILDVGSTPTNEAGQTMGDPLPVAYQSGSLALALQFKAILSASVENQWKIDAPLDRGIFPMFRRHEEILSTARIEVRQRDSSKRLARDPFVISRANSFS